MISRKRPGALTASWNPRGRVARYRRGFGIGLLVASGALATGCTDAAGYDLDYILSKAPFIATMRTSVAYESQILPRPSAAGTVPVSSPNGEVLAPFTQADIETVAPTLTNPLTASPEVVARGAVVYQNQCAACHAAEGEGNGPVVGGGRFPLGPTLTSGTAPARSDGYIYAVIRVGRGLMPGYGPRISHDDRWAVVHYVRELQGQL